MNKKYQSEAMQVIHEDMKGMHQLKIVSDARMHEFDEMCLTKKSKTTTAKPAVLKTAKKMRRQTTADSVSGGGVLKVPLAAQKK